ncbi:hypothetical protein EWB00_004535 [Schistosoma japonicum]|uniref:Uncharacterized protein n=1 Tax=Schistosoma japonicum TaxID=6182 RepID=A0A4Z2DVP0_SCHJA|nr:hypothetical protein EWB00_004535 [Schistosoma japonicum]
MLRCTPTPCYMHRCKLLIRKQSEYIEMMHSKKRFTNSQEVFNYTRILLVLSSQTKTYLRTDFF